MTDEDVKLLESWLEKYDEQMTRVEYVVTLQRKHVNETWTVALQNRAGFVKAWVGVKAEDVENVRQEILEMTGDGVVIGWNFSDDRLCG